MNLAAPALACELIAPRQALPADTLGLLCYGEALYDAGALPCAHVDLPLLEAGPTLCEAWRSAAPATGGARGPLRWRADGRRLFGCLRLPDAPGVLGHLREATRAAYTAIFAALDELGYPHLVRCWNYLADINGSSGGLERYRQFNLGRHEGFALGGRAASGSVPAACALGTAGGPLVIAFLAARAAPLALENPRQLPAYDYPPDYGPQAPTFARAALLPEGDDETLLISGTASIVGHRTVHAGDAGAQTVETLANLRALLGAANRASRYGDYTLDELALKVYVRHRADLPAVRAALAAATSARCAFLLADICRADLLLEIEAAAGRTQGP